MKYIVFKNPIEDQFMICFPEVLNHAHVASAMKHHPQMLLEPVSAGFCDPEKGDVWGKSVSLKLDSRPEDKLHLKMAMRHF